MVFPIHLLRYWFANYSMYKIKWGRIRGREEGEWGGEEKEKEEERGREVGEREGERNSYKDLFWNKILIYNLDLPSIFLFVAYSDFCSYWRRETDVCSSWTTFSRFCEEARIKDLRLILYLFFFFNLTQGELKYDKLLLWIFNL